MHGGGKKDWLLVLLLTLLRMPLGLPVRLILPQLDSMLADGVDGLLLCQPVAPLLLLTLARVLLRVWMLVPTLLARMQEAGLVERWSCPKDGRGQVVGLTDAGRDMRRRMWAVYGPALHEAVGCRLSSEESAGLAALLSEPDDVRRS